MVTLLFFVFLYLICKALKRATRPRKQISGRSPTTTTANPVTRNLATLHALQEQRDEIEQAIAWCDDLISTEDNPEKVLRWMTKRSQLKGQLATVQTKISKLTG